MTKHKDTLPSELRIGQTIPNSHLTKINDIIHRYKGFKERIKTECEALSFDLEKFAKQLEFDLQ